MINKYSQNSLYDEHCNDKFNFQRDLRGNIAMTSSTSREICVGRDLFCFSTETKLNNTDCKSWQEISFLHAFFLIKITEKNI